MKLYMMDDVKKILPLSKNLLCRSFQLPVLKLAGVLHHMGGLSTSMRKHLAVEVARQWHLFTCDVSPHTGGYIVLKETNTLAVSTRSEH